MSRPLRIEFHGALYHITSRGDRGETIYEDDEDREIFLSVLAEVAEHYQWICYAYCLMTNHYHLLVETAEGNLSKGMRQLNGVFTQASNRRHQRIGHLFQGRFKAILVDKDAYLMELSRYVVLNPVRAGMVDSPKQWPWSSYQAMLGIVPSPKWMATDGLLNQFGTDRVNARARYQRFVQEGIGRGIWTDLRQQIYLGDDAFVERMQANARIERNISNVPLVQRQSPAPSLEKLAADHNDRDATIVAAHATGVYSYREIAEFFNIHPATIGRIVRNAMQQCET